MKSEMIEWMAGYLKSFKAIKQTQRANHAKQADKAEYLDVWHKCWENEIQSSDDDDKKVQAIPRTCPISEVAKKSSAYYL